MTWLSCGHDPTTVVLQTIHMDELQYWNVIEPYMPNRVMWQLKYVHCILTPITHPTVDLKPSLSKSYKVEVPTMDHSIRWQQLMDKNLFA